MDRKASELFHAGRQAWFRNDLVEAINLLRAAQHLVAGNAAIEVALGAALLKSGNLQEGLPLFDRWRVLRPSAPSLPYPQWRGQAVAGKRLLIWSEHGLGDQIQWARYAVALQKAGAAITWFSQRPLLRLFEGLGFAVLPDDQSVKLNDFDFYCPSSALPLGFRLSLETLDPAPYIPQPEPERRGARIGVVTTVNLANDAGRPRALDHTQAARLLSMPGAINLAPEVTGARDFADTAAIVAGLDRVVTVDTSVAHLAGGMGVPTSVLVPFVGDWRWFHQRSDSPWYASATVVRQGSDLSWAPVIDQILAS